MPIITQEDAEYTLSFDNPGLVDFENLPPDDGAPFLEALSSGSSPTVHYYMFCTIEDDLSIVRPMYHVRDTSGLKLLVAFHVPFHDRTPFSGLAVGTVMGFTRPMKHWFMDGQVGIRVEEPDDVITIPFGMSELRQLNDYLRKSGRECKRCEKVSAQRCARCKIWYCSQDCQKKDWKLSHQNECKIAIYLREVNNAIAG